MRYWLAVFLLMMVLVAIAAAITPPDAPLGSFATETTQAP
jgi:hypothetical protein